MQIDERRHGVITLICVHLFSPAFSLVAVKPTVLTLAAWYLPGYKAGGLVRSLASLVEWLGEAIDFLLVARDHDFQEKAPYPGVVSGRWQRVGSAEVLYVAERELGWRFMRRLLRTAPHDALYLNSLL